MIVTFHLIVSDGGKVRTTKTRPNLNWDEIEMKVKLDLPAALFQRPRLEANITVPAGNVEPHTIDLELQDNIKEAIQTATGFNVQLTVLNQGSGE